jgi:predicted GIY-YIG superfamily endonuclease
MLIFTIKTIFLCIELEKEFKKDIRNTKEEILLNHNFDKNEIHFLLDY